MKLLVSLEGRRARERDMKKKEIVASSNYTHGALESQILRVVFGGKSHVT